jgi:hypothetical protein
MPSLLLQSCPSWRPRLHRAIWKRHAATIPPVSTDFITYWGELLGRRLLAQYCVSFWTVSQQSNRQIARVGIAAQRNPKWAYSVRPARRKVSGKHETLRPKILSGHTVIEAPISVQGSTTTIAVPVSFSFTSRKWAWRRCFIP